MSDPVDGRFLILSTVDGGSNWNLVSKHAGVPESLEGEAAFAASGTCIIAIAPFPGFMIATGGNAARILRGTRRTDGGMSWRAYETSITHGTSGSGIFSIAMSDAKNGVIVGGNYEKPEDSKASIAFTTDGGLTWSAGNGLSGYRSAVAYIDKKSLVAVGTNGTDMSDDGGRTWKKIGSENLNAVAARGRKAVWAVGPKGLVVKLK
jgi:photosystem II stability/assembly factor-like uncharacterized protein